MIPALACQSLYYVEFILGNINILLSFLNTEMAQVLKSFCMEDKGLLI